MVLKLQMERLELSKQKLLGPKSSASTNFATSAYLNTYFKNFLLYSSVYILYMKLVGLP